MSKNPAKTPPVAPRCPRLAQLRAGVDYVARTATVRLQGGKSACEPALSGAASSWSMLSGAVANVLFPPCCTLCAAELPDFADHVLLCDDCRAKLQPAPQRRCPRCAAPVRATVLAEAIDCNLCRTTRWHWDTVFTLGDYQGDLQTAILRTKHVGGRALIGALANLLAYVAGRELAAWAPDALVPVPMHWRRRLARGANNVELLASRLAAACISPAERRAIRRSKATTHQGWLRPRQRVENVRGAFRLRSGYDWRGARVLIVDDVLTTGATTNEMAKLLKQAGAAAVAVAVLARGVGLPRPQIVPAR